MTLSAAPGRRAAARPKGDEASLPTVSVIIPHFNDLANLDRCLTLLADQTYPSGRLEVVVGDNDSPQGLAEVKRAVAGRAKVVLVRERGAGPARNGAVAASSGAILAFIDSDCRPEPQWISEGVQALGSHDFVGGRVTVAIDDWKALTPVEAFERVFAFNFKDYILRKGFTGSGNLFCRREVFQAVGGFRTGVSEDVDWSRRATGAGFRLGYAPKAVIGHPARRDWAELVRKWRRLNQETFGLACERRGGRIWWLMRSLALPLSAVAHTPRVLFSDQLYTLRQRLMALQVLYAIRLWRLQAALRLMALRPAAAVPE